MVLQVRTDLDRSDTASTYGTSADRSSTYEYRASTNVSSTDTSVYNLQIYNLQTDYRQA